MPIRSHFNTFRFNEQRFNSGPLSSVLSTDLVVFNDYSLSDGTSLTIESIEDSGPDRDILGGDVPRDDGMFQLGDYWRRKEITVKGYAMATSSVLFRALIDTVRYRLSASEGNLDITEGSVVRRYIATLKNMASLFPTREHYHTTWLPFTAVFECRTPFATDRDYTITDETMSSSPTNLGVYNSGTAKAAAVFLVVFDSASSVTVFQVRNTTNGEKISVTPNGGIAAGDYIEFDGENKRVKINGSEANFTGSFPRLEVGGNTVEFTITGTSFSAIITVKHKARYL